MTEIRHGMGSKLMGADDKPDASDEGTQSSGPQSTPPKAKKPKKKAPVSKVKGLK